VSDDVPGRFRRLIHPFVPAGFHDPIGLARRLLRSKDPSALFAMRSAALAPAMMPLDLLLAPLDHLRCRRAGPPQRPILFVCGCARSGTTLTAQVLIRNLPVAYFNNLISLFPRAPLTAQVAFGRLTRKSRVAYQSYYGRTHGWSGANDALSLWDRWLGNNRSLVPRLIGPAAQRSMVSFFGAMEQLGGRPILGKNNALNVSAHLVAEALPTARFICVERSRIGLAQSLLKARVDIHGSEGQPYGLMPPDYLSRNDPVEDVCRQILFHEEVAQQQVQRLGPERFQRIRFEDVLQDPRSFTERIGRESFGAQADFASTDPNLAPFPRIHKPRDNALTERIEQTFRRIAGA
jgi:Sulfotransferase family